MLLIINNSGPLKKAYSTPKLISFMKKSKYPFKVVSKRHDLNKILVTEKESVTGIILSGSDIKYTDKICTCKINMNLISLLEFTVPILGICFGFQTIGISFGGKIQTLPELRKCKQSITLSSSNKLFDHIPNFTKFQEYNHDYLAEIPPSFRPIAYSDNNILEGIVHFEKPIYGIQFHPELSGKYGTQLLYNFLKICKSY